MRIWFTEIGEPLPFEPQARLHRYGLLTRYLARQGHDVTWWTSNFTHTPKLFLREQTCEEQVEGVRLKVLAGLGYRKNISLARFRHHAHFARSFYRAAQRQTPPDLIISPIPTIETAYLAVRYGQEHGVPVLTDIRDEWPDEFVDAVPKMARPLARIVLHSYFRRMKYVCQNVTGIMGISRRQLEYGLRFAGRPERATDGVFPLGYPREVIPAEKLQQAREWWDAFGLRRDVFTCCYIGSINGRSDLETVIRAAQSLHGKIPVQVVLCGDGSHLAPARELAANNPSVLFPGWIDAPRIATLLEQCDVGLVCLAPNVRMALNNKVFEYFSGKLAVLACIPGELEELLNRENCGLTYEAGSAESLAEKLQLLYSQPELCHQMGENAYRLFTGSYDTEVLYRKMETHFHQIIFQSRAANLKDSLTLSAAPSTTTG